MTDAGEGAYLVPDGDVIIVDAARETRYQAGSEVDAKRVGLGLFGFQQRIAARQLRQLSGRTLRNDVGAAAVTVLRSSDAGALTLSEREDGRRRPNRSAGIVAVLNQADQLRIVQLDDAGCAGSPYHTNRGTENRQSVHPLHLELVGMGLHV